MKPKTRVRRNVFQLASEAVAKNRPSSSLSFPLILYFELRQGMTTVSRVGNNNGPAVFDSSSGFISLDPVVSRLWTGRVDCGLNIIFEDADLLVLNKPAGLVCHPTKGDVMSSLISRARLYLGGNPPPHLVNRLDRETSGVILIARNASTAGELGRVWEQRAVRKEYLAIVHGTVRDESGTIDAALGKDTQSRVAIKDCVVAGGATAQTDFLVKQRFERKSMPFTLLRVLPRTGRKHQIRIHLAHLGHPIVGDKIYGGDEDCYLALVEDRLTDKQRAALVLPHHALHASALQFEWRGAPMNFGAEPEPWFQDFIEPRALEQPQHPFA